MKKLLGIVVLGLLWCNIGFAEWTHIAETEKVNEYIDEETIGKEDGITYFWSLRDNKNDKDPPSTIIYYAVKCEVKQFQILQYGWYDKHMGEGEFSGNNPWPINEWRSPPPGTVGAKFIKFVCK
jgi:hypothetical protein